MFFFCAEWLLDGLAGFLTEHFVKRYLGNNEARYRRFKVGLYFLLKSDSSCHQVVSLIHT